MPSKSRIKGRKISDGIFEVCGLADQLMRESQADIGKPSTWEEVVAIQAAAHEIAAATNRLIQLCTPQQEHQANAR